MSGKQVLQVLADKHVRGQFINYFSSFSSSDKIEVLSYVALAMSVSALSIVAFWL